MRSHFQKGKTTRSLNYNLRGGRQNKRRNQKTRALYQRACGADGRKKKECEVNPTWGLDRGGTVQTLQF